MSSADATTPTTEQSGQESKQDGIFERFKDLIRPCSVYKDEYKECKSLRGRFNQYFIYGESLNCDQWRDDYNNCQKFSWFNDKEAAKSIVQSELNRRAARFKAHYDNDVWTKRESPPADWAKPLPDFMVERNKNTYLEVKAQEMKDEEQKLQQQTVS